MRQKLVPAASLAALLLGGILMVSALSGSLRPGTPPVSYLDPAVDARLDDIDRELADMAERLEEAAAELELASSGRLARPPTSRAEAAASEAAGDASEGGADDGAVDEPGIGELLLRLDDLETRIRGLEVDPIQRGYEYLASESSELRRQGILALERVAKHDPEALEAIRRMLDDPSAAVRTTTLDTLADLGDKDAAGRVLELLGDPDARVRLEAVQSAQRLGAPGTAVAIQGLLEDSSEHVRERVADALGQMKARSASAGLIQALQDSNERVQGEAIASLGEIGDPSAAPHLRAMYNRSPDPHRVRLVRALRALGDDEPFRLEVARLSGVALEDPNESARRNAVRTLAWVAGRDAARETLEKALEDPSAAVRREAQRALGERRDERRR